MSDQHLIFEPRALPRYFAVMRNTSGGSPSYQICETEIIPILVHNRSAPVSVVQNADIRASDLHLMRRREFTPSDMDNDLYPQNILEWRVKNFSQEDADVRTIKYWYLPHYFFWNEYHIPVLDFNRRFFLTRSFERLLPPNVLMPQLYQDKEQYLNKRRINLVNIPFSNPRSEEPNQQSEIPNFVIDLLIKDQIEKNNNCSITMTSFEYMPLIGVTPCFHIFDYNAIQRWVDEHHRCPVCRKAVTHAQEYTHPQRLT